MKLPLIRPLLSRLVWAAVVLWGTTIITFLIAFMVPADPARVYAGANADAETIARIRHQMGLEDPMLTQYGRYLGRALQGDLGVSLVTGERVLDAIRQRIPTTAALSITAIALWMLFSVPLGVWTATNRGKRIDRGTLIIGLVAISLPVFWLARMLQYYLAYRGGAFPVGGFTTWKHILLPALALALVTTGYYARLVHSHMVEVLNQDYIRVARAKGLSERRVLFRHGLRNALTPVITVLGIDMATLLGGVVFTENVFALPGLGALALQSVFNLDLPMIMGVVLFSAAIIVFANILVDFLYHLIDPRVSEGRAP